MTPLFLSETSLNDKLMKSHLWINANGYDKLKCHLIEKVYWLTMIFLLGIQSLIFIE